MTDSMLVVLLCHVLVEHMLELSSVAAFASVTTTKQL